ncbi:sigma 54-interacting transcriptional regulator [Nibricoccus sp. IMCC34717]|uniref:sigma-54-dependent transcriptional regulator n=1 Tax=Nibricoccus sp. IMCC34717 TaxID=3034021 RepID=UPI00384E83A6
MSLERILVLDDEPLIQKVLDELFRRKKFTVSIAGTIAQAEAMLARETFDLIMLDVRLPDGDGQQFLERVSTMPDRPLVVMMTGHGTIESAVACMRAGAFDYLIKPFSPGQIEIVLRKAETYRQLVKVNRYFSEQDGGDGDLLGRSPAMLRLRTLIERVAPTDATVLITGENGTGKEMIARELYRHSPRRNEPYIKVNCAALSENLIESELFGHEKGSFTGATDRREGRFELANRGTLLLDEVSEIPPGLQAKLLRVLQEREFERVGGTKTIKVNVRILATSNRDLMQFVEKGHFRSDLYYRLNVFPVQVPPLRERVEDVPVLAEAFLRRFARKHGLKLPGFSDNAQRALCDYSWPGNVRELQNTIERAVILSEDGRPVSTAALGLPTLSRSSIAFTQPPIPVAAARPPEPPFEPQPPVAPIDTSPYPQSSAPFGSYAEPTRAPMSAPAPALPPFSPPHASQPSQGSQDPFGGEERSLAVEDASPDEVVPLDELEKRAILAALKSTGGNRTRTADLLRISIRTLRNKLNEYRGQGIVIDGDEEG